jgi:hypothetical protein
MESTDRSIAGQAAQNSTTANDTAGQYGSSASQIKGTLIPTLNYEASGKAGLDPTQTNNLLVAGQQGSGGGASALAGSAALAAARTRNSGSLSGVTDDIARHKLQADSSAGLNVQNESTQVALDRQKQAQQQLQGLYGTDVSAQLGEMGIGNQALNTELAANKQGWLQNTEGALDTLSGMGKNAASSFAALQ